MIGNNRYYLLNRPPSIGTQPPGFTNRETRVPRQDIPANPDGYDRPAWGYVDYDAPLPLAQVFGYELEPDPANRALWLVYRYWLDASQSVLDAEWFIREAWTDEHGSSRDLVDRTLREYRDNGGSLNDLLDLLAKLT